MVRDGALHVGERGEGAGFEQTSFVRCQQRHVDLDDRDHPPVRQRHHRVKQRFHFMALCGAFVEQRVDEEGHIWPGRLEHGAAEGAGSAGGAMKYAYGLLAGGDISGPCPQLLCQEPQVGVGQSGRIFARRFLKDLFEHLAFRPGNGGGTGHGKDSPWGNRFDRVYSPGVTASRILAVIGVSRTSAPAYVCVCGKAGC